MPAVLVLALVLALVATPSALAGDSGIVERLRAALGAPNERERATECWSSELSRR